jgi:hypothetical protein
VYNNVRFFKNIEPPESGLSALRTGSPPFFLGKKKGRLEGRPL